MDDAPKQTVLFDPEYDRVNVTLYRRLAEAQRGRFFRTRSALWFETRRFVFDSAPPHRHVSLEREEANYLFRRGAGIIRYTCEAMEGSPSFEFVCNDKDFGMHSLAADARRRVRRGLSSCAVRQVGLDLLVREGVAINRSVLERQGRSRSSFLAADEQWKAYLSLCSTTSNVKAFGAFVEDRLCAFALTVVIDGYCYLYHTHAHSDYLKQSPMNALIFAVTSEMLANPEVTCVSQGVEPFLARPDLEHFKLAMGYRKRMIRRQTLVNPLLRPFVSRPALRVAEVMFKNTRPQWFEALSKIASAAGSERYAFEPRTARQA
jgi:hypothetical protein